MWSFTFLRRCFALALALYVASIAAAEQETDENKDSIVSYYQQIRPLFQAKCQGCHQPAKPLGEYVMTSFERLLKGGETGDVAIVPGKPDESYLIAQITPVDGIGSQVGRLQQRLLGTGNKVTHVRTPWPRAAAGLQGQNDGG